MAQKNAYRVEYELVEEIEGPVHTRGVVAETNQLAASQLVGATPGTVRVLTVALEHADVLLPA